MEFYLFLSNLYTYNIFYIKIDRVNSINIYFYRGDKGIDMNEIYHLVRQLGIHANLSGYYYLVHAIALVADDNSYLYNIAKRLYPKIAEQFNTTSTSIDRNLRTVIRIIWERGNLHYLEKIAGYSIDYKPSNGEIIDILASYYNHFLRNSCSLTK